MTIVIVDGVEYNLSDIYVILEEEDAARLLRTLYNGHKPRRVHTLICLCGAMGDLRVSPKAWNGWQVLPHAKCPRCLRRPYVEPEEIYPLRAEERFLELIGKLHQEDQHEEATV